jgi:hypothetical protein
MKMIKVEVNQREIIEEKESYPCLKMNKISKDIVLFSAPGKGTLLTTPPPHIYHTKAGDFRDGFKEDNFEKFNGTITLSNG